MVNSLQCWKCISDDCEGDMESNNKAEKVTCKIEESCMVNIIHKLEIPIFVVRASLKLYILRTFAIVFTEPIKNHFTNQVSTLLYP